MSDAPIQNQLFTNIGKLTQPWVQYFAELSRNIKVLRQDVDALTAGTLPDGDYGDITVSASGTVLTIDNDVVTNAKLDNMNANTVKVNATALSANPTDLALFANNLLGRGASGNVTAITVDSTLAFTGDVLGVVPTTPTPLYTNVVLASTFSTALTTPQSVTNFKFTPAANKTYLVEVYGLCTTTVASTLPRFGLTWPSTMTDGGGVANLVGATGTNELLYSSGGTSLSPTGTGLLSTNMPFYMTIWMRTGASVSGDLQIVLQAEASGGGTVGIVAGAFLRYCEIS